MAAGPELIRLHYAPGTRAVRVRWLLEEIGVPYHLNVVDLRRGAHKSEDHLKLHPLGKVPALEIDDTTVLESLGICLYLADRFAHAGLAPFVTDNERRARYYTLMAFSSGTLEPAILEMVRAKEAKERGAVCIGLGPALTPFDNVASYLGGWLWGPWVYGDHRLISSIQIEQTEAAPPSPGKPALQKPQRYEVWIYFEDGNSRRVAESLNKHQAYQVSILMGQDAPMSVSKASSSRSLLPWLPRRLDFRTLWTVFEVMVFQALPRSWL